MKRYVPIISTILIIFCFRIFSFSFEPISTNYTPSGPRSNQIFRVTKAPVNNLAVTIVDHHILQLAASTNLAAIHDVLRNKEQWSAPQKADTFWTTATSNPYRYEEKVNNEKRSKEDNLLQMQKRYRIYRRDHCQRQNQRGYQMSALRHSRHNLGSRLLLKINHCICNGRYF